ncbi:multiple RNA-binding domain-containing protein 1 isoform X2 [Elaeis guineensis]|uniref:Multiple RNA-binding domain-containing protein 1 isoform X1 n=2 Tax=Elaeis guineensis var. tenera TaxID=51953 RepID=A0A6I9QRV1_ELAGV|nr:multiple RNA-binding domain-containing protein 1 isoform X1 [Elaeis guineensis]
MSRICVKNLPNYVKEDRLREFFSQKGEVTDAKLMRTKDGKSRQFAFIGFRTEKEAEEALKYFNNTYMDTRKIMCEIAHKVGDPNIPRSWSRYSARKGGEDNKDSIGVEAKSSVIKDSKGLGSSTDVAKNSKEEENNDPKLQEFLQIMQPRVKSKLWANDTLDGTQLIEKDERAVEKEAQPPKSKRNESAKMKVQVIDGSNGENGVAHGTSSVHIQKGASEMSTEQSNEIAQSDVMTDMEYFKSRIKKNWSDSETDNEDSRSDEDSKSESDSESDDEKLFEPREVDAKGHTVQTDGSTPAGDSQVEVEKETSLEHSDGETDDKENPTSSLSDEKKQALDTGRLFIRNLPYTTTEDELMELFGRFGDISHVHIVVDKDTKRSKGIAYVLYTLPESAVRALEELDNSIFQGRLLHVMPAKPQNPSTQKLESDHATSKKTFKQQREEQRKASEASGDTRAWNSLFMRPDTVVENIARKHGINKSDLLDREADDLAVRIALGETHVIAETKKALSNAGVNLIVLEEYASKKTDSIKRSNHVILVKNLPYSSCEADLVNMFGKFGSLDKIILPPTRALALVIFLEAAEARAAFKGLAYKRYKDAPLYLEWAPAEILSPNPTSESEQQKHVVGEQNVKKVLLEQSVEGLPEEDIDPDRVESRSLFVKNLNFKTSDESLKKHFGDNMKNGSIRSGKVKKHIKNGKNVSMGFGFIEFDSVETATNVCKDLQGTVLDGHALILQLCHAKKDGQVLKKDEKDRSSTKLLVRNVAFEATEKDLRQLFSPFGQIRSLRLPMKFGSHRGFAFVEYVTKQEAQNALKALSSTHLYGRHLVLEKAKEGESLEELRARTAAQFVDENNGFQMLSKKRKHMTVVDEGNVKFARIID